MMIVSKLTFIPLVLFAAALPAQDARNTQIATTNTVQPLPVFTTLQAWQARRVQLRQQILVSTGLSPMPPKPPLHPQVFGKLEGSGYTVEKVLIETLPGFYLGGNLYRPRDNRPQHPAILNPHGHWQYGRLENEPIDSGPAFGISLARQGYVVFAFDMVGYNDTLQLPHRFGSARQRLWSFGPMGLQLWNSVRALDFVAALPDVDAARIGMAGASGGGTQTFLLAAIDDRIQFDAPANMVSTFYQGGDLCENAPGLHLNATNVEIAALFAPKPMLLVSDTTDWTRNMPRDEFPAIQRIYALYGAADKVSMVQIEAPHNFNQPSREAVYKFFSQVNPGLSAPAELKEHHIDVPMLQDMLALSNRTLPPNALDLEGVFKEWRAMAEAQNRAQQDPTFLRDRLRQTLAAETPATVTDSPDTTRVAAPGTQSIALTRPGSGDHIPALWIPGRGPVATVVDPEGAESALKSATVAQLRKQHRPVLLIDAFQTGVAKASRKRDTSMAVMPESSPEDTPLERRADQLTGGPKFLSFNVTDDQARVQDILTALAWAHQHTPQSIDLYATGLASVWSTYAAAITTTPIALHATGAPSMQSDDDYLQNFNVPGILRAANFATAQKLGRSAQ